MMNPLKLHYDGKLFIRDRTTSPLILVKPSGEVTYAKNKGDKDRIVENFNPATDKLLWPWAGEYSTDVFELTKDDLDKHYR